MQIIPSALARDPMKIRTPSGGAEQGSPYFTYIGPENWTPWGPLFGRFLATFRILFQRRRRAAQRFPTQQRARCGTSFGKVSVRGAAV